VTHKNKNKMEVCMLTHVCSGTPYAPTIYFIENTAVDDAFLQLITDWKLWANGYATDLPKDKQQCHLGQFFEGGGVEEGEAETMASKKRDAIVKIVAGSENVYGASATNIIPEEYKVVRALFVYNMYE